MKKREREKTDLKPPNNSKQIWKEYTQNNVANWDIIKKKKLKRTVFTKINKTVAGKFQNKKDDGPNTTTRNTNVS